MDHQERMLGPRVAHEESRPQHHYENQLELPLAASRSDPPGFDIPQVRQMEWWLYRHQLNQKDTYSNAKSRQLVEQIPPPPPPLPPAARNLTPHDQKQAHSYKEYIRARRRKVGRDMDESDSETVFSWVPMVVPGKGKTSPYGTPSNYRSLAAQEIFSSAVPKRSWSTENEDHNDDPPTHSEQTVITNFEDSSWVMPLPTKERAGIVVNKEVGTSKDEEIVEDEEETVEEVLVDDDGNSIEEEILEEDVVVDDDGNEIIEEEVSASESSTSEDTQELLAENKVILNSHRSISVSSATSSSHEPNPFMPPKSTFAQKQLQAPRSISSRSSRDVTVKDLTTRQEEKDSGTSSVSSSSSTRSSRRSNTNSATEDSGSTQIIYVRDPRDLDEIVEKCFDGGKHVRIVDDPNPPADDDSDYVPSKQMLIFLCLLVVLVALSIILGTAIYFKG